MRAAAYRCHLPLKVAKAGGRHARVACAAWSDPGTDLTYETRLIPGFPQVNPDVRRTPRGRASMAVRQLRDTTCHLAGRLDSFTGWQTTDRRPADDEPIALREWLRVTRRLRWAMRR